MNGVSSCKSTAFSVTTRGGSSKGSSRIIRQNSDIVGQTEKYKVIETSL